MRILMRINTSVCTISYLPSCFWPYTLNYAINYIPCTLGPRVNIFWFINTSMHVQLTTCTQHGSINTRTHSLSVHFVFEQSKYLFFWLINNNVLMYDTLLSIASHLCTSEFAQTQIHTRIGKVFDLVHRCVPHTRDSIASVRPVF